MAQVLIHIGTRSNVTYILNFCKIILISITLDVNILKIDNILIRIFNYEHQSFSKNMY